MEWTWGNRGELKKGFVARRSTIFDYISKLPWQIQEWVKNNAKDLIPNWHGEQMDNGTAVDMLLLCE